MFLEEVITYEEQQSDIGRQVIVYEKKNEDLDVAGFLWDLVGCL